MKCRTVVCQTRINADFSKPTRYTQ